MRTHPFLATALALLALTACRASPANGPATDPGLPASGQDGRTGPGTAPTPPAAPPAGTLTIHDGTGDGGPLSLASLSSLTIDAAYQGFPGGRKLRVDAIAPGGALYAQLGGALDASSGAGTARHGLEVRGTAIDLFHLVGVWQFVLTVDGTPLASAAIEVRD